VDRTSTSRIGVPYGSSEKTCPVRSLQASLESARISDGPVFRSLDKVQRVQNRRLSDKAVARIVKRRAADVGWIPSAMLGILSGRSADECRRRRRLGAGDRGPDRPSPGRHGQALHQGGELVAGERGQSGGALAMTLARADCQAVEHRRTMLPLTGLSF